jgi:large subunit ribosomal protein L2|tara:strand:- start:608 stop:1240 length:633 start_codon:yes stop_codon:yes gene_type:complete
MPRATDIVGEVTDLVHSPVHSAPLARVKLPGGETTLVSATEGIAIGSSVAIGDNVALKPGNITRIANIPEGTAINNLELRPGDGGKIARAAGNSCIVEARIGDKVRIRLPSGAIKELPENCRATIGVLSGHGRDEMPLRTAGAAYYKAKARGKLFPHVSGVAMNPVDHPHGGGNHQAVHGPSSVARGTPPGAKVGLIAPSRSGRGRGKKL